MIEHEEGYSLTKAEERVARRNIARLCMLENYNADGTPKTEKSQGDVYGYSTCLTCHRETEDLEAEHAIIGSSQYMMCFDCIDHLDDLEHRTFDFLKSLV